MSALRVFLAVDIEDPELVSEIKRIQGEIIEAGTKIRLVRPENLHFTVKFLGPTDPSLVPQIGSAIRDLGLMSFSIMIGALGAFPTPSRPRIIWIGVRDGEEEFEDMMAKVDGALSQLGFPRESRKHVAHATIARVKYPPSARGLRRIISERSQIEMGRMLVREIRIKGSTLTPAGPIYKTLDRIALEQKKG